MPQTATSASQTPSGHALAPHLLEAVLSTHRADRRPALERFWAYYRNPPGRGDGSETRPQARALPRRLTQPQGPDHPRREIVIENDIAWRIDAGIEFAFGQGPAIKSLVDDPAQRQKIEALLQAIIRDAGGPSFYHDLSLLGSIFGYVDVLVQPDPTHRTIRLELLDPPRVAPVINPDDYRRLDALLIDFERATPGSSAPSLLSRVRHRVAGRADTPDAGHRERHTHVWAADRFEHYVQTPGVFGASRRLIDASLNPLGRVPVIHIQNAPQPFRFEGISDVEPLIPLQDELNTRLSDRANRITFQSFKMYLGIGVDGFSERPVGPGQMWATQNTDARIQEFGGDGQSPTEESHITELREAMDKASSVTPVVAGLLGGKIGNLTSENALRIVLMGLLSKTRRKRMAYGRGLEAMCEMVLHAADVTGLLPNRPEERRVHLDWPDPMPDSENRRLRDALTKKKLGVPGAQILAELGYAVPETR